MKAEIGSNVTSIGDRALFDYGSLTDVVIPDSVTSFGEEAFMWCASLTSVAIPDSVTDIGYLTFDECSSLAHVTIGSGMTFIADTVFDGCIGLNSVTFKSFTKNEVKYMTIYSQIFGVAFFDGSWIEKSFTAICTDGSMTVHFSADYPATITFTDL